MKLEIATLEAIDAWSVIDRLDHHVIASTWAFKCKRYPDGLIKKFTAHLCARGDKQLEGTDYLSKYFHYLYVSENGKNLPFLKITATHAVNLKFITLSKLYLLLF